MADETLNALVTEAMFRALDEKKREELIKTALATLITPRTQGYGQQTTTPIQDAFDMAIHAVARDIVAKMIKTDEAQDAIRKIASAAFEKMLIDKERLATEMANAMVQAIVKAGNY